MPRNMAALLSVIGLAAMLAGCNTVSGLGRDIANAGNAVTGAAGDEPSPGETQQARQPDEDEGEPTELQ